MHSPIYLIKTKETNNIPDSNKSYVFSGIIVGHFVIFIIRREGRGGSGEDNKKRATKESVLRESDITKRMKIETKSVSGVEQQPLPRLRGRRIFIRLDDTQPACRICCRDFRPAACPSPPFLCFVYFLPANNAGQGPLQKEHESVH